MTDRLQIMKLRGNLLYWHGGDDGDLPRRGEIRGYDDHRAVSQ